MTEYKWDESQHPRDSDGKFGAAAHHAALDKERQRHLAEAARNAPGVRSVARGGAEAGASDAEENQSRLAHPVRAIREAYHQRAAAAAADAMDKIANSMTPEERRANGIHSRADNAAAVSDAVGSMLRGMRGSGKSAPGAHKIYK